MESPNSPSSPDMSHKRAGRPQSPPSDAVFSSMAEDKEKVTYVRFLVSNTAAGCIIGKGGSTITEFQTQSGARIQLSRNHEFFPGTSDRIIMISGALDEIAKATELITEKLFAEADDSGDGLSQKRDNNDAENRTKLRLIVPNGCCGGIIGKGGTTIKSFIEDSQAGIKISPQDNMYSGVNDRIVTLTGSPKEQLRALCLILSKLSEDAHYSQSVNIPYPYAGFHGAPVSYVMPPVPYNAINYGQNGAGGKFPNPKGNSRPRSGTQEGHGHSVTIGVADEHIGAVVGRGGRNIMEITQASGARIKISDRGDFMTGTTDRKVTITGSQEAIRAAEDMIMQRISMSAET